MTQVEELKEALRANPLRIGISTRALFDLEEEHKVFRSHGVQAYAQMQRERETVVVNKGAGFEVIERLLNLNELGQKPYVEVVLLSKNSPDLSLRAFRSIEHYGLTVITGSFTSGGSLAPFIPAWEIDLFLSNDRTDVQAAVSAGAAAAHLGPVSANWEHVPADEVRIAFDGDAVVFSAESDEIYKTSGLEAFRTHEQENATKPMTGGPLGEFLKKLSILREIYLNPEGVSKVRIGIVTARDRHAHARVINTLRAWGTPADEAHFVGTWPKAPILKAFGAHIFFDDQEKHVLSAAGVVPSGHVPGPHSSDELILVAE